MGGAFVCCNGLLDRWDIELLLSLAVYEILKVQLIPT